MPAQLSFFDIEVDDKAVEGGRPYTVSIGPNGQSGDLRIVYLSFSTNTPRDSPNFFPNPPDGFAELTVVYQYAVYIFWQRLTATSQDAVVQFNGNPTLRRLSFTVRGVDPSSTPTYALVTGTDGPLVDTPAHTPIAQYYSTDFASFSAPSSGAVLALVQTGNRGSSPPTPGWSAIYSSANSGANYTYNSSKAGYELYGKSFAGPGSTGTTNVAYAYFNTDIAPLRYFFFKSAPDSSVSCGSISTTGTASAATFSNSTAVTVTVGDAAATSAAGQVFNPLYGYRVSDPLILPGAPVTGSRVSWAATAGGPGSAYTVETSINNGASWDGATNGAAVARLRPGNTLTRSVLTRVTLSRPTSTTASPRITSLETRVACDASVDELVALATGIIDKVITKATGGLGSGSGGGGGSGVRGVGGGQSGGAASIKIKGVDLSKAISRNVWERPFIVNGMNYADAVEAMVRNRLPTQTEFSMVSTQRVTPLLIFGLDQQSSDPWQDITELAMAIGYEAFFDAAGTLVFRPVPDPRLAAAVWELGDAAYPTVVEASRELTDEQTYNYVVVKGESTETKNPVSAVAFDDDPASTTNINGRYGRHAVVIILTAVLTQEQAQTAADAILLSSLGQAETVTITGVPMPALEPGDIITVNISSTRASGRYLISQMTTPLSAAEGQQLTCFRQSDQQ